MINIEESKGNFEVEILSKGSCIDTENGNVYQIDTYTLKVSHQVFSDWVDATIPVPMDCYEADEYHEIIEKRDKTYDAWITKMCFIIGTDPEKTQYAYIQREFFACACVYKVEV
jgi:hypothetical protein